MVIFGPDLGQSSPVGQPHVDQLDTDFRKLMSAETRALRRTQKSFESYLTSLVNMAAVPQSETISTGR